MLVTVGILDLLILLGNWAYKVLDAVRLRCDNAGRGSLWAPSFRQINDSPRALSGRRPPEPGGAGAVFVEDDMRNATIIGVLYARAHA